jgi:hypothetical protein
MPAALVLDDDRLAADHLCQILTLLEFPAVPAYSWRAGLLALEEEENSGGGSIEVLFLGLNDHEGEGSERPADAPGAIARREIAVILVVPPGCKNLVERMEEVGARATIPKPPTIEAVANVLVGMNLIK